jgi:hypothetical protein
MTKLTTIKWAGPNTPCIKLTDSGKEFLLSKKELKDLRDQIDVFTAFYQQDFEQPNIEWVDNSNEPWHPYTKD